MGLEPICLSTGDFKSPVYTIPPSRLKVCRQFIKKIGFAQDVYYNNLTQSPGVRLAHKLFDERTSLGERTDDMRCLARSLGIQMTLDVDSRPNACN